MSLRAVVSTNSDGDGNAGRVVPVAPPPGSAAVSLPWPAAAPGLTALGLPAPPGWVPVPAPALPGWVPATPAPGPPGVVPTPPPAPGVVATAGGCGTCTSGRFGQPPVATPTITSKPIDPITCARRGFM